MALRTPGQVGAEGEAIYGHRGPRADPGTQCPLVLRPHCPKLGPWPPCSTTMLSWLVCSHCLLSWQDGAGGELWHSIASSRHTCWSHPTT